jgi:hypothetical protein
MAIKLQIRRGLAADWANPANNPVLLGGEIGFETDTGNFKIGDGTLAWNSLAYSRATYPQITGAGTDLNGTGYRAQGRYEVLAAVVTNVPSGWTPASDAPGVLIVTRISSGNITQVLFSTKTQRVFSRAWDGTNYTTWVALSNHDGSVATAQLANDSVTADKLRDDASTDANRAVTTDHIRDLAITTAKITNSNVTYAKIQNVSATDRLLGRSTAGAGVVEEITCTSAGRALIDDADTAAQRTTLGLTEVATSTITQVFVAKDQVHGFTIFNCPVNSGNTTQGHLVGVTTASTAFNTGNATAVEQFGAFPLLGWSKVNAAGIYYLRPASGTWTIHVVNSGVDRLIFAIRTA